MMQRNQLADRNAWAWLMALVVAVWLVCLAMGPSGLIIPDWSQPLDRAIFLLRLQRVAAGFLVGGALATAGLIFQALLRNPLAEPYVLGVSSGAGLGATLAIVTGIAGVLTVPLSAFVFGLATLVLVYFLARQGGAVSMYALILSGVIVSAVCSSLLMFVVSIAPLEGMHSVLWWMLGNLQAPSWALLHWAGMFIVAALVTAWWLGPDLNALTLGRDMAHHLGVRTRRATMLGLCAATLATAAAVGLAGIIGFVGLIVPHAARALFGTDHRRLAPAAALGGGCFLAISDALARTVMAPVEIPVGVVTALVGGPFFLVLLRSRRKKAWIE